MKFRISVLAIILSTAAVIGLINFLVNKTSGIDGKNRTKDEQHIGQELLKALPPLGNEDQEIDIKSYRLKDVNRHITNDFNSTPEKDGVSLSSEDEQIIKSVASLSETDLANELVRLKAHIEKEDLFGQLNRRSLSPENEAKAKKTLERFALLGLEGTRRKYLGIEPELKDAVYAHRESLKEIRELLNE
jgi:hypothetical protein